VSINELFDSLWSTILLGCEVNLLDPTVTLSIKRPEKGQETHHRLCFRGVSEFRWCRQPPDRWDYCEFTSIEATPIRFEEEEGWQVTIELWCWENRLEIRCAQIELDGVRC